jgi:hypothetical protein
VDVAVGAVSSAIGEAASGASSAWAATTGPTGMTTTARITIAITSRRRNMPGLPEDFTALPLFAFESVCLLSPCFYYA